MPKIIKLQAEIPMITIEEAFALLKIYNKDPFHIQHALTIEAVMKWYKQIVCLNIPDDYSTWMMICVNFQNLLYQSICEE